MSITSRLAEQIIDWEAGRKEYYEEEFEHFTYRLESVDEELEIGGHTLKFVDWVIRDTDASLFVFSVDGELYALRGSVSSWGNSWDRGIFPVHPVTVVTETYEES